jgi:hypothetical protein
MQNGVKNLITIWSSNTFLGLDRQNIWKHDLKEKFVHSNIVHNSQKVEAIGRLIEKQNVAYPYSKILFNLEKERHFDTYYNCNGWSGDILLTQLSQSRKDEWFHLHEVSRSVKFIESRMVISKGWEER